MVTNAEEAKARRRRLTISRAGGEVAQWRLILERMVAQRAPGDMVERARATLEKLETRLAELRSRQPGG